MFALELGFLAAALVLFLGGMYYISYYTGYLSGFAHLDADFAGNLVIAKLILYFIVFAAALLRFIASRIFKRSRKRVALLKSTVDNIQQVIVNLKSVAGK